LPAADAIASLGHAFDVLRCFTAERPSLKVSELANATGLPRQTVQRLAHTLAELGCLETQAGEARYRLGRRLLPTGRAALARLAWRERCRPILQRLADDTGTSVALGTADGLEMLYLEYCVSAQAVTFVLRTGSSIPLSMTAMGRAYLWALGGRRRASILSAIRREAGHGGAEVVASIQNSFQELDSDGYCCTFPSARTDICGVGAPLVLNGGDTVLAVNCGAARLGLDEGQFRSECGPALRHCVDQLRAAIGDLPAEELGIAESLHRG
jgi:IclR family transcriptional regulator, positive regulator for flagellar biogenesis